MIERPPSPEPVFLAYLDSVLEDSGSAYFKLGRCREALCHRINRIEDFPIVLKELMDDAVRGARGDPLWAEATVKLMRNRIWRRLQEVKAA